MHDMNATIAICTWNRAKLLDRTLAQMQNLHIPAGVEWELLVVNNDCTDHTDEVIARHRKHLPLRALSELRPGKSFAGNLAVKEAKGELILWTDDDVIIDPHWLSAYVAAAVHWPDASYFGGIIEPWFEVPPPAWISQNLRTLAMAYALKNYGNKSRPFQTDEMPYGANMAIRKKVFESVCFDTRLGPTGNNEMRGEEVALITKLQQRNHVGVWVSEAKVHHYIPTSRLTRQYIWAYHCGFGQSSIRVKGVPAGRTIGSVPRWLFRQYYEQWFKSVAMRLLRSPDWVGPFTRAAITRGMIAECGVQSNARS
jgi:glycosyltransferase involved in cell wall biosynthesis